MSVAERLERLARFVPGVAGYQDRERSRDTDKKVRLRCAGLLKDIERVVEAEERRLTEAHALDKLAALGRLTAKLDKIANEIQFAGRGYRGLFDTDKLTQDKIEQVYTFDLNLFGAVGELRSKAENLAASRADDACFAQAIDAVDHALDDFEKIFSRRSAVVTGGEGNGG